MPATTLSRRLPAVLGALAAVAVSVPAAAGAQPTLSTDKTCYQRGEDMVLTGAGFAPGAGVGMAFAGPDALLGTLDAKADAAGNVKLTTTAPDLPAGVRRVPVIVAAGDRGLADVTVTRADVRMRAWDQGRVSPHGTTTLDAYGLTMDVGRSLYAHYTLNGRLVRTVRIGRLSGPCGDIKARGPQFQPGMPAGSYTVRFDTMRAYSKSSNKYTVSMYSHVVLKRAT
jgi:hypothetical protein